jgi:hypothetical protein
VLLRDHFGVQDVQRRTLVDFYTTPDHYLMQLRMLCRAVIQ